MAKNEKDKIAEYCKLVYSMIIEPDKERAYLVSFPDIPGVNGFGKTTEKAIEDAEKNKKAWMTRQLELQRPIPKPGFCKTANGTVTLRMSKTLHYSIIFEALQRRISINQLIVDRVKKALDKNEQELY